MEATIGLDDSAYQKAIQNVQSDSKKMVATLSSEYSKAAKSVAALSQKYNESVAKTGKTSSETKNLKTMLAQAEAQLKATTSALKAANNGMDDFASSTEKASGTSLSGAIAQGTIMAGVFQKLGSVAFEAAKSFISAGLDYNAQIETYTTGLTNMLGSAEAAQQAMENIQQDAARTPFSVDALVSANQYLISAGENATYARKTIMALGDAVSATGGGSDELNRMAQNLQQIANVGKASAVDIKQFAMSGINVYGILADYTGKSTTEVQNMTISYELLTQALQAASEEGGRYYGKSTQDGTPTPDAPVPIVSAGDSGSVTVKVTGKNILDMRKSRVSDKNCGVTYTRNADYSFTRTGTATETTGNVWPFGGYQVLPKDDLSNVCCVLRKGVTYYIKDCMLFAFEPISFTGVVKTNKDYYITGVRNEVFTVGKTYNDIVYPSVFVGKKDLGYEPYREQLLTLPTPNGLPGIPVSSGGNYTDPQGQQWICDEVDLERGVKVQRVNKTAFDTTKAIAEQNNATLATPIETPLTPAEIAAYKALATYGPDTVVQASDGAGIKLDYQRDVNIAIKKLEDAIASMT